MAINLLEHVVYVESVGMEMIPASVVRRYIEEQTKEMQQHVDTMQQVDKVVKEVEEVLNDLHNSLNE